MNILDTIKKKCAFIVLSLFMVSLSLVPGCSSAGSSTATIPALPKIENLRLVGTIGPLSIPLAYMAENNVMASVASKTTLTIWSTPAQLQAIIGGNQGDFVSLPTNSAATFYNKGVQLKLLDCSIWNILFLVSSDPGLSTVAGLKGKRITVPYQGAVPDAIFRYVLTKQGINPDKDIDIYYAPDPVQASQLLLSGQEKYALLSEPSATSVIAKAAASGLKLYRNVDMGQTWLAASPDKSPSAIAGTIALGDMAKNDEVMRVFVSEYKKAVAWVLANPEEAGELGARVLSEQGFTADVLTESARHINWKFETAAEAHNDIEKFFAALMGLSPNFTGGKMPDNAFYYGN
jgi:NitT/TauT family transport system substrate-binding protein